jgi:predicted house-cleaning noncanonical NTP pyrophosphatase (MazG superfamily)
LKIIKYNKLVRDKIPQIIESTGKKALIEKLNKTDYKQALDQKLKEELNEYLENGNIDELTDLIEVVFAILDCNNHSVEVFEKKRIQKKESNGAFKERILLKEVMEE